MKFFDAMNIINIRIKYFVPFDQLMGSTENLPLFEGAKIQDCLTLLGQKYRDLGQAHLKNQLIILINGSLCSQNVELLEGDEISLLTPLLGG